MGLTLRFKITAEHVIFLDEQGKPKATRPATPAELILWGELTQLLEEHDKAKKHLQEADERQLKADHQTLKITRLLQEFPGVTTEQLQDPVEAVSRLVRSREGLHDEVQNFGEWLDREFPGELNGTEGILGTAARLLRGSKRSGTPKKARQRGGVATREAREPSESREATAPSGTDRV